MNEDLYALLCGLIATPSISGAEKDACDLLEEWLQKHGLFPKRKGNNLWCETNTPNVPVILLNAHIDTVKPASSYTRDPYKPELQGDKLYGLGSNDDGGSLIALIATYIQLSKQPQPYRLILSLTSEEETSGVNGWDLIKDDIGHVDFAIVGEPTGMQMALAEKGLMVLDCTAHGKAGHAAREEGVNAIYEAMKDIEWFKNNHFERISPYLGEVKTTVTMVNAGTQHNVVPDECHFTVDVRPNGMYTNVELLNLIKQSVTCDVKERSTRLNSSHIEETHPAVVRGKELGLLSFGSPTLSNQALMSFPTLKIGPGDSARSHSADEYICLSEITEAVEIYCKLLNNLVL